MQMLHLQVATIYKNILYLLPMLHNVYAHMGPTGDYSRNDHTDKKSESPIL